MSATRGDSSSEHPSMWSGASAAPPGRSVLSTLPKRPGKPFLQRSFVGGLLVRWAPSPPAVDDGRGRDLAYRPQYRVSVARNSLLSRWEDHDDPTPNCQYMLMDLVPGTEYVVRVRGVTLAGEGPWSDASEAMTVPRTQAESIVRPTAAAAAAAPAPAGSTGAGASTSPRVGATSGSGAAGGGAAWFWGGTGATRSGGGRKEPDGEVEVDLTTGGGLPTPRTAAANEERAAGETLAALEEELEALRLASREIAGRGAAPSETPPAAAAPRPPPRAPPVRRTSSGVMASAGGQVVTGSAGGASAGGASGGAAAGAGGGVPPPPRRSSEPASRPLVERLLNQALARETERRKEAEAQLQRMKAEAAALDGMGMADLEQLEQVLDHALRRVRDKKDQLLKEEAEDRPDSELCVVCQDNPKTVLLMPCRHLCLCGPCNAMDTIKTCPLCRTEIQQSMQVFT